MRPRRSPDNDLSVYDGQHDGTVRRLFTRRFLALETTGNRLYPTQVAAMRALPPANTTSNRKPGHPINGAGPKGCFICTPRKDVTTPRGAGGYSPRPFTKFQAGCAGGNSPRPGAHAAGGSPRACFFH